MNYLSKGIIQIAGFTIKPGTSLKEMQEYFGENVRLLELSTGPRLKLLERCHITENIYSYAFNFNKDGILSDFSLHPVVPAQLNGKYDEIAKYKINISKNWLKETIEEAPSSESKESISYAFNWGYIRSATRDDIHYGLIGGEIDVRYEV